MKAGPGLKPTWALCNRNQTIALEIAYDPQRKPRIVCRGAAFDTGFMNFSR